MHTFYVTAVLRQPTLDLHPTTLRGLNGLKRALRQTLPFFRICTSQILRNGQVFLAVLARRQPPRKGLAQWVKAQLDAQDDTFVASCAAKQRADTEKKTQRRKQGFQKTAPLAGVVIGKDKHPKLYKAFFDMVKAEALKLRQQALIRTGLTIAGVKSSDPIRLLSEDLIDPYTVLTHEGNDIDFRAEDALRRLARAPMELARVYQAEEVKSKHEEAQERAALFAHEDYSLLSDELRQQVMDEEGLFIPWDASLKNVQALAESITDPHLQSRVMQVLEQGNEVDDRERIYLKDGAPAFKCRKLSPSGPYKPYTPTVDVPRESHLAEIELSDSPFAGESFHPDQPSASTTITTASTYRMISQGTYDSLLARRARLQQEADRIADLMGNALEDGDLRESAAYDEARGLMFANQRDLRELEDELSQVQVGDVAETLIGSTFVLNLAGQERQVRLTDGQPTIGEVSTQSPLGQALLTAQPGQQIEVQQHVKTSVPTSFPELTPAGLLHRKREVPKGLNSPLCPDTVQDYTLTRKPGKREQISLKTVFVEVLSMFSVRPGLA
ncbi:transcription elongation factor [Deinococcus gobiensis]|uniref:Transcription elongation factor n=1 Tax=Deinococcus gobiensis (strain DSM 21396 / JCM 16679 / CGMCC 1.7299 / I-0) TaxID=745776 RepID=H8H1V5_DEIGI|nr:transcription elongation factor [Deinococcus gobiensis]AFD27502.1 Transcription elongation factor [Deinococcus gobiensis I-0]